MLTDERILDILISSDNGQEPKQLAFDACRAIEVAACAERDARIAELEALLTEKHNARVLWQTKAAELERQLAEARKQMESQKDEWLSWEAKRKALEKDAERYQWLRNESWAGYNMSKGFPHVFTEDGAGNRRMMLAEDAMDQSVDAAMKKEQT